ncbi:anti-sigma-E factor ChrR [Microbulbifer aestuariivivens]|uniref:Anti-sigma-E factor ChrR n=1 Tax=Microbulbifer aestuariivivens TaxID=1908308 RepID=A0ABP9WMN7_9GAMM
MIRHHPDQNMLLEYAAGSLPWGMSLAVSSHLQLCPQCRQQHEDLNDIGGALLNESEPQIVETDAFAKLMGRLDQEQHQAQDEDTGPTEVEEPPVPTQPKKAGADPILANLPKVVGKLVSSNRPLKWKRVSSALRTSRLATGQDRYEVAFQRICRGGRVAEHDHRGREVTVVLVGSFSDADGVYCRGDFLLREPGDVHRPIATQDQECLCLSVLEAPVKVTGPLGWLVNPFLSFRPN